MSLQDIYVPVGLVLTVMKTQDIFELNRI